MKKRIKCAGGCGTMVLAELGECRKCRRARVLAGKQPQVYIDSDLSQFTEA